MLIFSIRVDTPLPIVYCLMAMGSLFFIWLKEPRIRPCDGLYEFEGSFDGYPVGSNLNAGEFVSSLRSDMITLDRALPAISSFFNLAWISSSFATRVDSGFENMLT